MGAGASTTLSNQKEAVQSFKHAVNWYVDGLLKEGDTGGKRTDAEIEEYLRKISPEVAKFLVGKEADDELSELPAGKVSNVRGATATSETETFTTVEVKAISKVQALARGASVRKARGTPVAAPSSSAPPSTATTPETSGTETFTTVEVKAISKVQALARGASVRKARGTPVAAPSSSAPPSTATMPEISETETFTTVEVKAISKVQAMARGALARKARGTPVTAPSSSAPPSTATTPEAFETETFTTVEVATISKVQAMARGALARNARGTPVAAPSSSASHSTTTALPPTTQEEFEDSTYHSQWLPSKEADELFAHLKEVGEKQRPRTDNGEPSSMKYPLWTLYYGTRRAKDNAIALDRWGSYHESWIRVEEPSEPVAAVCEKLRKFFKLPSSDVNSIVVNYYFDGDTTYIPAHRDTVACLKENSTVICLSLGAARSFLLVDNENSGGYVRESMDIKKEWLVSHGDLFAMGQKTNEMYCHAVPKEPALKDMRISVIFRTVSKSFVDLNAKPKDATYASGKVKVFTAECIKATGFDDLGEREHVADLISERERVKLEKAKERLSPPSSEAGTEVGTTDTDPAGAESTPKKTSKTSKPNGKSHSPSVTKMLSQEDDKKYFLGEGLTVPVLQSS